VPVNAPDQAAAHRLIEALLTPEIAATTVVTEGFATPNDSARAVLPPALRDDPVLFPSPRELARCQIMRDVGAQERELGAVWMAASGRSST
jgi:spermidine/putrescine-binding protein